MTTDDLVEHSSVAENAAAKLEELAALIRSGSVMPGSISSITTLATSILSSPDADVVDEPDEFEDSGTPSTADVDGMDPATLQFLFRGWYLTMMMTALTNFDSDDDHSEDGNSEDVNNEDVDSEDGNSDGEENDEGETRDETDEDEIVYALPFPIFTAL